MSRDNATAERLKHGGGKKKRDSYCSMSKNLGTQRMEVITSPTPLKEREQ